MTVVNFETGELVALDSAAAERRAERITLRLDAIADNYRAVLPMIREAIEKRDDIALGYRSPGDYVSDRFGQSLAGLGIEVRRAVVGELTEAGLSTRAIAPVVGVSNFTVQKDREAGVSDLTPEPEGDDVNDAQSILHDLDDVVVELDIDEGDEPTEIKVEPGSGPEPKPVVGIDGKTYKRPEIKQRTSPRKPLPDSFRDRLYDLLLKSESLHRLTEDDRWATNAKKLATEKNRNELLRINDLLQQVINSLPNEESTHD